METVPAPESPEVASFLDWVRSELKPAETALHNGDASPRRSLWSRNEPVSVLGAWRNAVGQPQIDALFGYLAASFSDCASFEIEVLSCDVVGDMAYTVCHEHTSVAIDGERRSYTLRVTQIYRREDGKWRVAHRHGDQGAKDKS